MTSTTSITLSGHITADLLRSFRLLPFNVPENTARIDISYACEPDLSGGLEVDENPQDYVADLALFDPRGAEFMGKGYRGSSGNSRSVIFIAASEATPGYMPGSLQAGEWNIMLGFYKVGAGGCSYRVDVTLTAGAAVGAEPPTRLPLRATANRLANATHWYKGDLHCHTFHSDGGSDPRELVSLAENLGLDFLAITDHNTFTQQVALNQIKTDLILIPGCEVTTFQGHWNTWGDGGWIDFRVMSEDQLSATIAEAVRQGYLTSCNHPRPNGPPWRYPAVEGYHCVEVWNGAWEVLNDVCLEFWERQLRAGKRLVAVGGSDCHHPNKISKHRLAQPTTYIYCDGAPSAAGILNGLRAGHAFITLAPNGPQIVLRCGAAIMGDVVTTPASGGLTFSVQVIGGVGLRLELHTARGVDASIDLDDGDTAVEINVDVADALYVRAQLRDLASGYVVALTNPIYLAGSWGWSNV